MVSGFDCPQHDIGNDGAYDEARILSRYMIALSQSLSQETEGNLFRIPNRVLLTGSSVVYGENCFNVGGRTVVSRTGLRHGIGLVYATKDVGWYVNCGHVRECV